MSEAHVPSGRFTLALKKEDFKFSSAHFTLFGAEEAERLHGHNYRVAVEISGAALDDEDLLADFVGPKREIRRLCAILDSRMLLPTESRHLDFEGTLDPGAGPGEDSLTVRYGERRYAFPREDVVLMPLRNISIEALARWFWQQLAPGVASQPGADHLAVEVGETDGQSCWFRADLRG